jgi:hypothetical protein
VAVHWEDLDDEGRRMWLTDPGDFDNLTEEQLDREIAEEVAKITAEIAIAKGRAML